MELHPNNTDAFIRHCIQRARNNSLSTDNNGSQALINSSDDEQNSILMYYIKNNDEHSDSQSPTPSQDIDTLATQSPCSEHHLDYDTNSEDELNSVISRNSDASLMIDDTSQNRDEIPKSCLQIKRNICWKLQYGLQFSYLCCPPYYDKVQYQPNRYTRTYCMEQEITGWRNYFHRVAL